MDYTTALAQWCGLSPTDRVLIITDCTQRNIAEELAGAVPNGSEIFALGQPDEAIERAARLSRDDLLIVLLSIDSFVSGGANRFFSPFGSPANVAAKYAFIRLDIGSDALRQGLSTPKAMVYGKIFEMNRFGADSVLRVTSGGGTDITLKVSAFETCSHEITEQCRHAFLPPSETSSEVAAGSANGTIAVDVTVGQLYYYGKLLGVFGLVPEPVKIVVKDGVVADILGGGTADELKEKLFALPVECRELVELGQGLSKMEPTSLIGVDESIIDTCHFGIGDGGKCGVHLDVVISRPTIVRLY